MLLISDININSPPYRESRAIALQLIAINGYILIALRLIECGVDINAAGAIIEGRIAL